MATISPQNLGLAVGQYLEQELAPKSTGLQKVMLYLAVPVLLARTPQLVEQYGSLLQLAGVQSENGSLELDGAYTLLKEAVHKAGKVPIFGIIFDESDVDKIYAQARPLAEG